MNAVSTKETQTKPKGKKSHIGRNIALTASGILAATAVALVGLTFFYSEDKIHPGIHAGDVAIGGLSREEATRKIEREVEPALNKEQIKLHIGEKDYPVEIEQVARGIDKQAITDEAYAFTHEGNLFTRIGHVVQALFGQHKIPLSVDIDEEALDARLQEISDEALAAPVDPSWKIEGDQLIVDRGEPGLDFNRVAVRSAVAERIAAMDFKPFEVEAITEKQKNVDLAAIKADVDAEPKSATVDKNDGKTILPSQDGYEMDIAAAQSALTAVGDNKTFTVTLKRTPAAISAEQLSSVLFRDTLASMSSDFSSSNSARANNVERAASKINGTILNPGDEFSYNNVVGERTPENGFREAGAYVAGKLIDEVGGGVCQPSSTLYRSVLRADLQVTERTNHGLTVGHTPKGEDATVSWGSLDFRFVNNTGYPIKIIADSSNRKLTMTIVGTKTSDKQVSIENKIVAVYEPQTVEKQDASLPAGTKKVDVTPMTGYRVDTYKTITENGQTTTVKVHSSTYKKRDKVVLVGPQKTPVETPPATTPAPTTPTAPSGGGDTAKEPVDTSTSAPEEPVEQQPAPAPENSTDTPAEENPEADPE